MNTFAKQPEVQQKALQKALKSPLIGKHGKRRETILKEEVYKEMQERILSKVEILIDTQIKLALGDKKNKPDPKAIESLLNRVFGKPTQEIGIRETKGMGQLLDEIEEEEATRVMANQALRDFIEQRKS